MTTVQLEPDLIPLAMLNAMAYCPRRFVYEFVQGEMLLNAHVVEGTLCHAGVDAEGSVWRGEVVQHRRVYVWSDRLRIGGFCDLVEETAGQVQPVEYKKGKPGKWLADHVQLCGQALCLEERTGQAVGQGAIFYFAARRREVVLFSPELRAQTEQVIAAAHALVVSGALPPPVAQRAKCRDCSLEPMCMPRLAEQLERWRARGEEA